MKTFQKPLTAGEEAEYLRQLKGTDKEAAARAKDILVERNLRLVAHIVKKYQNVDEDMEDLLSIGCVGLIKAIDKFDLQYEVRFSTYAVPLILGEIRRHIRDDGPIKVGRAIKKLGAELMREQTRIISETGCEPHISELAAACGVSVEDAAAALDAISPVASLSEGADSESGFELFDRIPDESGLLDIERACDRIAISQAVGRLPLLWRQIVVLRYFKNYTQQRTADALGLTQVKISREEKKIVEYLREELSG